MIPSTPRTSTRATGAAAVVALTLACGGPSAIPDAGPVIQLSKSAIAFEVDAYTAATLSPVEDGALIGNGGATPPAGAPTAAVQYQDGSGWLEWDVSLTDGGYRLSVHPTARAVAYGDAGIYQATVLVAWGGASRPARLAVTLTIRPSPQTWHPGSRTLADVRYFHSTTALEDGGALTVGGVKAERSIEQLDPITGTWGPAGQLHQGRYSHTATLLEDGRVFIAGGESDDGSSPAGTWEIWDPATRTISAQGALATSRYDHGAVRLLDGRVLLVGGWRTTSGFKGATRSCEIFDPASESSVEVAPLHGDAAETTPVALLQDGSARVLALASTSAGKEIGAELFDPSASNGLGAWTVAGSRLQARVEGGLVALPGGRVVAFGGLDPEKAVALTSSELFDPATGQWRPTGPLYAPHAFGRDIAVLLPSGRALVAGGEFSDPLVVPLQITASVEAFDPETEQWGVAGALSQPLFGHTVTLLDDGTVIAVAGVPDTDNRPDCWHEPAPSPSAVVAR
jgi:hypothetical protein